MPMSAESRQGREPESRADQLARTGMRYFVRISNDYPASTPAQGVALARLCQASGETPQEVINALKGNLWYREVARRAAIGVHKKLGKGPQDIRDEGLDHILDVDSAIATEAMVLELAEIDELLAGYPASMKSKETKDKYRSHVMSTIATKQRSLRESRERERRN